MQGSTPSPGPDAVAGTDPAAPVASPPSLLGRTLRVFVRPFQAWEGLEHRAQWWFPVLLTLVVSVALTAGMYDRVIAPTAIEQLRPRIESGQISEAQAESYVSSPVSRAINLCFVGVAAFLLPLVVALGLWFAVGFVLGSRFGYRLALEVASWSMLVSLPATFVKFGLAAWQEVSLNSVHTGLGALIPLSDPPGKLQQALAVLLDVAGPFSAWLLVVQVAGCSALSGASRKNVAWVLAGLFVAVAFVTAVTTYLVTPAS
jgi:hypothetical protein